MGDWDTRDSRPNGHVVQGRKLVQNVTSDTDTPYFDNPAYRDDVFSTPVYRKNRSRSDERANHLIYDVSRNRSATINSSNHSKKEKKRNESGSSLVIRKNADEYGTNRYSEPLVLNVRQLDKMASSGSRKHHSVGRNAANVYYTKSRKTLKKLQPTGVNTFQRHGTDRKANCISFFDIETDKVDSYQYRPGEEVSGAIIIMVKANIEIRYVELQVIGEGVLTLRNSKDGLPRTVKEFYLKKSTCVIGSADSSWTSLLTPGHYTSKFRVKLPPGLPSSQYHQDASHGFKFEVNYTLKGRICDDVTPSTSSRGSLRQGLIKAIMSRKAKFNVQRSFDLNNIPGAMGSLTKTEHVSLSCTHKKPATVSVTVERAVFLAGDDIRLQLSAKLPGSQRVKEISCCVQEQLVFGSKAERLSFTIARIEQKDPQEKLNGTDDIFDIAIPTRTDLISSFALGQGHIKVTYTLEISLRFKPAGGKLFFQIPVGIGPCAEPIYGEKISSKKVIPVFNRPTRFPTFSPTPQNTSNSSTPRPQDSSTPSTSSVPVISKYSNSVLARCFLCCRGISASED